MYLQSRECVPDRIQANPKRSFTREDTNRASATVVHHVIVDTKTR